VALELVLLAALAGIAAIGLPKLWQAERSPTALWIAGWASASTAGVLQLLDGQLGLLDVLALPLGTLFPCLVLAGARLLVGRPATRALLALALVLGAARVALFLAFGQVASHGLALAIEPALVVTAAASVRRFQPGGRLLAASFVLLAIAGLAHLLWFARGGPVSLPIVAVWLAATPPLLALQLEAGAAWARRELEAARAALEARVEARTEELARVNASLRAEIDEHRATEAERRRLALRVQEAQRLESLAVVAGGVAHDFNNLLTVILNHARLALPELPAGAPSRARLERIRNAAEHGAALTQEMLVYAGRGSSARKPVELSALVDDTLDLARASVAADCRIDAELAPNVWVEADATQLRQVVLNLVQNAAEARRGAPVRVSIRTSLATLDAADLADARGADEAVPGLYALLEVSDDGEGIDVETERRIFDPFFTTKLSGRGLGLAAVLGIVRGHGGAVTLRSAAGTGSTFRALLPAAPGVRVAAPVEPPRAAREGGLGARVLVVDDDDAVVELTREVLSRAGYAVVTASGGRAALERLADAGGRFDAAVVDIAMPDVDGEQVMRALHAARPSLPVVLASGWAAADASARLAALGAARFLAKPWTAEALEAAVRGAIAAGPGAAPR
jgi:signal transduction histidine kinase/ActR/RegA family two-component response regulator